jgi:putative membrane protein
MMGILVSWAILTIAVMAVSYVHPGVKVENWGTGFVAAAVLGILNVLLKPILVFFATPFIWLTLGLFTLVINALLFYLVSKVVEGFRVRDFLSALGGAAIVSVVSWGCNLLLR